MQEIVYWMKKTSDKDVHAGACIRDRVPEGAVLISEEAYLFLKNMSSSENNYSIIRELIHAEAEQDAKFQPTALEMRYP